jgi:hypothetical protein
MTHHGNRGLLPDPVFDCPDHLQVAGQIPKLAVTAREKHSGVIVGVDVVEPERVRQREQGQRILLKLPRILRHEHVIEAEWIQGCGPALRARERHNKASQLHRTSCRSSFR